MNLLRILCFFGKHDWQIGEVNGEAVYKCARCGVWRSYQHGEGRRL